LQSARRLDQTQAARANRALRRESFRANQPKIVLTGVQPLRVVNTLALALLFAALARPAAAAPARLAKSLEFKTTAAAQAHCPGDLVVWSTLTKSKAYHLAASRYYGKTKHGAYVCEKDANAAGFHQAKS